MRRWIASMSCACVVTISGCAGVETPRLFQPQASVPYQQGRAVQFDPYPDQDAGPYIEGGRPLDYNRQIPEVDRSRFTPEASATSTARWRPRSWFSRPAAPATAPPVIQPGAGGPGGF